jgi:hypothetical protein
MSEVKWYAKGELGEYVLDLVESINDGMVSLEIFIAKLREVGLSNQEIMDVYAEGLGV